MNKLVGSIKSCNKYAKFKTCKIKTHDCVQCCCNVFIAFASRLVVSSSAAGSQSAPHLAQHCQTSPPPLNNPHHLINSCLSHESLQAPPMLLLTSSQYSDGPFPLTTHILKVYSEPKANGECPDREPSSLDTSAGLSHCAWQHSSSWNTPVFIPEDDPLGSLPHRHGAVSGAVMEALPHSFCTLLCPWAERGMESKQLPVNMTI